MSPPEVPLAAEGRFARLEAIEWWDQARMAQARVLVVGAGALGNEVIKNLSLMGLGRVVVVDRDRVERSNLSRSVLFREADEGEAKAVCAARAARGLFPQARVQPLVANVLSGVGLGFFRWADVVVGALDNREARVFVNGACARVGRPWIDGGIDVLQGIARGFAPPGTACYECTMSEVDWHLLNQRRSCALLARRAAAERGTPTTPTTASVVGGIQAQEVIKLLHGFPALLGRGFVFDGAGHTSYAVQYKVKPECPWHEESPEVVAGEFGSDSALQAVWDAGAERLGGPLDALELGREIVESLLCPSCDRREAVFLPLEGIGEDRALCGACGSARAPTFIHSLGPGSVLLPRTGREVGLPAWDILWARRGDALAGIELSGDQVQALGAAA